MEDCQMLDEAPLRELVRRALSNGKLPRRQADQTWNSPGVGAACVVCEKPITRNQMEYEIQFAPAFRHPGSQKFRLHLRCFAAWELERTKFREDEPAVRGLMTTPSLTAPKPLPFSITGPIASWEPIERKLRIGERHCWVTPGVSVSDVSPGAEVRVLGHVEHPANPGARWIVTQLTLV
jgi:hypothetical protein